MWARTGASPKTLSVRWTATFGCMVSCILLLFRASIPFKLIHSHFPLEIPGAAKKNTPSIGDSNDVIRNRPFHTATTSNGIATASSAAQEEMEDFYRSSYEMQHLDGEEEDDDEGAEEDSLPRFVSITNPTQRTANAFAKHVPTAGMGRQPAANPPPVFVGPELVPSATTATQTTSLVSCRTVTLSIMLIICGRLINYWKLHPWR